MVAKAFVCGMFAAVLLLGCAGRQAASDACPDGSAIGLNVSSGFGVSIGESGLRAAFNSIRDFFSQRPASTEADKARAAELAADAAAKEAAQPMTEEQRRALRSQADQWVQTYTDKCRPGAR